MAGDPRKPFVFCVFGRYIRDLAADAARYRSSSGIAVRWHCRFGRLGAV